MTSDVFCRKTVQIEETAHYGDSSLWKIAPDAQALTGPDKRNCSERSFCMKVERDGICGQAEAYVHVAD
jgi:hypothetical protein